MPSPCLCEYYYNGKVKRQNNDQQCGDPEKALAVVNGYCHYKAQCQVRVFKKTDYLPVNLFSDILIVVANTTVYSFSIFGHN